MADGLATDGPRGAADGKIAITHNDLLRTSPGTLAGRYLRSYWQPIYRAEDIVPGEAKTIRVFSENFTLYRGDTGVPHLVAERCPHRGAKLVVGTVAGDTLSCAYHGWKFDGAGKCLAQPAEPRPFCDKVSLRAYPTQEYLGLVFAYLGEGEPPEFQRTPEFEDERFIRYIVRTQWPCNYWAQMENTFDVTHTNFLHPQFHYHAPEKWAVEELPYGLKLSTPGLSGIEGSYDTHYLHMPNVQEFMAAPKPGERVGFISRSWRIPHDEESLLRYDIRMYPIVGKEAEDMRERLAAQAKGRASQSVPELALKILGGEGKLQDLAKSKLFGSELIGVQDCTVLASLSPMADREHNDMLGQGDIGIAWLRRIWTRELQAFAAGEEPKRWPRPAMLWDAAKPQ